MAPSAVGGVGITIRGGDRKVYFEFYNDGVVYVLFADLAEHTNMRPVRPEAG